MRTCFFLCVVNCRVCFLFLFVVVCGCLAVLLLAGLLGAVVFLVCLGLFFVFGVFGWWFVGFGGCSGVFFA